MPQDARRIEPNDSQRSGRRLFASASRLVYAVAAVQTIFLAVLLVSVGMLIPAFFALMASAAFTVSILLCRSQRHRAALIVAAAAAISLSFALAGRMAYAGGSTTILGALVVLALINRRWRVPFAIGFVTSVMILWSIVELVVRPFRDGFDGSETGLLWIAAAHSLSALVLVALAAWMFSESIRRWLGDRAPSGEQAAGHSRTDHLTRLPNREAALEAIDREVARARRHDGRFALVMASADQLERVVDRHGPIRGEWVLTTVANLLRKVVRGEDQVARWSDDCFLLLLPDTDLNGAGAAANRIRSEVERSTFTFDEERIDFTLSLVAAGADGAIDPESIGPALERALDDAQAAGGNQVIKLE